MAHCLTTLALTLFATSIFTQPPSISTTIREETTYAPGSELVTSTCDGGYKGGYTHDPGACSHWSTYTATYSATPVVSTKTETITIAPGTTVTSSFPTETQYSTSCSTAIPSGGSSAAPAQVTPSPPTSTHYVPSSSVTPVSDTFSIPSSDVCVHEPTLTLYGTTLVDQAPGYSTSIGESTAYTSHPVEFFTSTCVGGYKGPYTHPGACSSWSTSAYTTWNTQSLVSTLTSVVTLPASTVTSSYPTETQYATTCTETAGGGGIVSNARVAEATTPAETISAAVPTGTDANSATISSHVGIFGAAAGGLVVATSSLLAFLIHRRNAKRRGMRADQEDSRYSPVNDGEEKSVATEDIYDASVDPSVTYGYGGCSQLPVQHRNSPPSTDLPPLPSFSEERV